jgi:hypothetical protein
MSELLLVLRVALRAPQSRRWLLSSVTDLANTVCVELDPIRRHPPASKKRATPAALLRRV